MLEGIQNIQLFLIACRIQNIYMIYLFITQGMCKTEGIATLKQPSMNSFCTHLYSHMPLLHRVQTAATG